MKFLLMILSASLYLAGSTVSNADASLPSDAANSTLRDNAIERFLSRIGVTTTATPHTPVVLQQSSQEWKQLTPNKSSHLLSQLKIGDQSYEKGLGAHSKGLAVFRFNTPFVRFVADVGIDNNIETAKHRGSVEFVVKAGDQEVARSPVMRGSDAAYRIDVPLDGVKELSLITTDAGDGIDCDQADWAEARVIDSSGNVVYLGDVLSSDSPFLSQQGIPASFVYDGQASQKLLTQWPREATQRTEEDGRTVHELTWREPGGGLVATWRVEVLPHASAMEFRWIFRNEGNQPTKTLSEIRAMNLTSRVTRGNARLLKSLGGLLETGFTVTELPLENVILSAEGGRSSNRDLPFFLLRAQHANEGILIGVGWSGQWQADFGYPSSPHDLELKIHVPGTTLVLPPGETLLTPSVLLGTFSGSFAEGGNALRRILFENYVPKLSGTKPLPPVSWNSWFVLGNTISEEVLKRQADVAAELGIEYFCIDAGWFGDFDRDVGNWQPDPARFPQGLRGIGDYVRSKGMKVGIWMEPERANHGTQFSREHPEWLQDILVHLANPEASEWLFHAMTEIINGIGAQWVRFDFNRDPLALWEQMDTPDSKGLAQARYIAALYNLLDRLKAKYPDLVIEGCSSGGRRIDLETLKRSHTLWKSDKTDDVSTFLFQGTGANQFLPGGLLNANLLEIGSVKDVQSLFCGPLGFGADWLNVPPDKLAMVKEQIAYFKNIRHLLNKDFYALLPQSLGGATWTGWQFHDPSTDEALCVLVRPETSPYGSAILPLHGFQPDRDYLVAPMGKEAFTRKGSNLMTGLEVSLPEAGTSTVLSIRPK